MSQTVWKFKLDPECTVEIPSGAQLLSVGGQGDDVVLWAMVDPSAEPESRSFVGFGTGHDIPNDLPLSYVGTAIMHDGNLVFHIFETEDLRVKGTDLSEGDEVTLIPVEGGYQKPQKAVVTNATPKRIIARPKGGGMERTFDIDSGELAFKKDREFPRYRLDIKRS